MTLVMALAEDPLFRTADQLPLGRHLGLAPVADAVPSRAEVRPFGLRFATSAAAVVSVDVSRLRYDPQRQVSVEEKGSPAFGRHSTGQTNTRTSDGYKSMDSDTDHTED